jgi:hypothetical protein
VVFGVKLQLFRLEKRSVAFNSLAEFIGLNCDLYISVVVLYVVIMPLGWIHNLPREEAEKLANELGVSTQGTLDELWRKMKDKWRALETCLPPQIADKFGVGMDVAGVSNVKTQNADVHAQISYLQIKLKCSVVIDLVRKIPV